MILVSNVWFSCSDGSVARKYIRHCIIDNNKYGRYQFKVKQ